MPRDSRIVLPGVPHHVTQRGVRSMTIFKNIYDRIQYMELIKAKGQKYGLEFLAYCLMSNHVHFIVIPDSKDGLSKGIGQAHMAYSKMINSREGVKGHLFQERFYSKPLGRDSFWPAVRYVEKNPVGVVEKVDEPCDYDWSSAKFNSRIILKDPLVYRKTWEKFIGSDWLG